MRAKINDYFTKEFLLFLMCNGFAAVVNFSSRIVFSFWLEYAAAIVIAYICGMITAFTLNKFFVFNKRSVSKTPRQFVIFALVNVLAVAQTLLFSLLFRNVIFPYVGYHFYPDEVAHLIGVAIPVFTSFLGHKYFSFRV